MSLPVVSWLKTHLSYNQSSQLVWQAQCEPRHVLPPFVYFVSFETCDVFGITMTTMTKLNCERTDAWAGRGSSQERGSHRAVWATGVWPLTGFPQVCDHWLGFHRYVTTDWVSTGVWPLIRFPQVCDHSAELIHTYMHPHTVVLTSKDVGPVGRLVIRLLFLLVMSYELIKERGPSSFP